MEFAQQEILFDKQSDCLRLTGNQEERSWLKLAPGEGDEDPYDDGWPYCAYGRAGDDDGDDGDAYGYAPPKAERKGIAKQKRKTTCLDRTKYYEERV